MKFLKKYGLLLIVLLLIAGTCVYFCVQKEGMFIDEIYTYGLSNGHYTPFVTDVFGGDMVDKVMPRETLAEYLTVEQGERFDALSVYYNQTQDVHPPLYYWVFNFASSFAAGSCSKWIGLIPNLLIYLGLLLCLFFLIRALYDSRRIAILGVLLYGLSTIGMSTMILLRMYVLLTFFTVLFAFLLLKACRKCSWSICIGIGCCILAGLMTQYYFVFYAFFACALFVVVLLFSKRFRDALRFSACSLGGVALFVALYPACIAHMTADKLVSGKTAVSNLFDVSAFIEKLRIFLYCTISQLHNAVTVAKILVALAVLALVLALIRRAKLRIEQPLWESVLLIAPAAIALPVVALVSPVVPTRYIYNLMPFCVLGVCMVAYLGKDLLCKAFPLRENALIRSICVLALAAVAAFSVWNVSVRPPEFLNTEHEAYNQMLLPYADSPCVYFDENCVAPVTQDYLQLLIFDDLLVTDRTDSGALDSYVSGHTADDNMVVFFDIGENFSNGHSDAEVAQMLQELSDRFAYETSEPLYDYGSSSVYLLSK